jgi:3-keto-L-gulonate-6-phosphate decarboxylase
MTIYVGSISFGGLADEARLKQDFLLVVKHINADAQIEGCRYYKKLIQLVTCNIKSNLPIALNGFDGVNGWKLTECKQLRLWIFFDGRYECYYERPKQTLTLGRNVDGLYYGSIDKK